MSTVNLAADDLVRVEPSEAERNKYGVVNPAACHVPSPLPPAISIPRTMPGLGPESSASSNDAVEGRKMSSVRRTFCLFVTFDLGLSFILWALYTQLMGGKNWDRFKEQVERYNIKSSLFDTVLLSLVRFTILLLAYALCRLRHWWVIAITTLLSCVFLLTKVFIFDFEGQDSARNPLSYCLLIISFVLAWVETWFLDFKVLPQEKKERQRLAALVPNYGSVAAGGPGSIYGDRRLLLPPDDARSTATFDQYYSPVGTPEGSDTEEGEANGAVGHAVVTQTQLDEYHRIANECWDKMWYYLTCPEDEWKHETGDSIEEGIIHSRYEKPYGKIFRLQGVVNLDAKSLWEEMVLNINTAPTWNPTLLECNTVMVIDENTDISHNVANEAAGGIVSSRDFVNLRHWGEREGMYVSAGHGVTHPDCPPTKKHIRGFNGPGGWAFRPIPGEPNKCVFIWVMNTDIKGWIPQRVVEQASSGVLFDYLKALRQHVANDFQPKV